MSSSCGRFFSKISIAWERCVSSNPGVLMKKLLIILLSIITIEAEGSGSLAYADSE